MLMLGEILETGKLFVNWLKDQLRKNFFVVLLKKKKRNRKNLVKDKTSFFIYVVKE